MCVRPAASAGMVIRLVSPAASNNSRYRAAFRCRAAVHVARCGAFTRRTAAWSASIRKLPPTTRWWYWRSAPCVRSSRTRDARASSLVVTSPASPNAPRFLLGKKEKHPSAPMPPAGPRRDRAGDLRHVDVEGARIDVDEHWCRPDPRHGAGRGEERVRAGDDLVARTHPERHEGDEQRVGAGADADGVRHSEQFRHLVLEGFDLRAHDEALAVADAHDRREHLVADARELRLEV